MTNPHTPDNWDAASVGYAEKVAPFLMETFAGIVEDRYGGGPIRVTNAATVGTGTACRTATGGLR